MGSHARFSADQDEGSSALTAEEDDATRAAEFDGAVHPPLRVPFRLVAVLTAIFVALAVFAWHRGAIVGDARIDSALLRPDGDVAWRVATAVSFWASAPVIALGGLVASVLLIVRRRAVDGLAVAAAPALAGLLEIELKSLVARPQPFPADLGGGAGNSFPSGHVSGFAALAVVLLIVLVLQRPRFTVGLRRLWMIIVALAIAAVSWSRVALGAHYATDTLAGALLGTAVALCAVPAVGALCRISRLNAWRS